MAKCRGDFVAKCRGGFMSKCRGDFMAKCRGDFVAKCRGDFMSKCRGQKKNTTSADALFLYQQPAIHELVCLEVHCWRSIDP